MARHDAAASWRPRAPRLRLDVRRKPYFLQVGAEGRPRLPAQPGRRRLGRPRSERERRLLDEGVRDGRRPRGRRRRFRPDVLAGSGQGAGDRPRHGGRRRQAGRRGRGPRALRRRPGAPRLVGGERRQGGHLPARIAGRQAGCAPVGPGPQALARPGDRRRREARHGRPHCQDDEGRAQSRREGRSADREQQGLEGRPPAAAGGGGTGLQDRRQLARQEHRGGGPPGRRRLRPPDRGAGRHRRQVEPGGANSRSATSAPAPARSC